MATFVPNGNFAKTFYTPGGEIGRWLHAQGKRTAFVSKTYVGSDTGKLKNSIKSSRVTKEGAMNLQVEVGSQLPYALYHHEDTKPHVIEAGPGKALHWGGRRGPTVVAVHHPGTTGTKFLVKGMNIVVGHIAAT